MVFALIQLSFPVTPDQIGDDQINTPDCAAGCSCDKFTVERIQERKVTIPVPVTEVSEQMTGHAVSGCRINSA